jgi:hypothetical protein
MDIFFVFEPVILFETLVGESIGVESATRPVSISPQLIALLEYVNHSTSFPHSDVHA